MQIKKSLLTRYFFLDEDKELDPFENEIKQNFDILSEYVNDEVKDLLKRGFDFSIHYCSPFIQGSNIFLTVIIHYWK